PEVEPQAPEDRRERVLRVAGAVEPAQDHEPAPVKHLGPPHREIVGDGVEGEVADGGVLECAAPGPGRAEGRVERGEVRLGQRGGVGVGARKIARAPGTAAGEGLADHHGYTSRKRCWMVGSRASCSGVPLNWMRPWSMT